MSAQAVVMPDPERLCVAFAKANQAINGLIAGAVATRLPKDWGETFLRVFALDATAAVEETRGVSVVPIQWDAYAQSAEKNPDYAAASLLARTVVAQLDALQDFTVENEGCIASASQTGPRRTEEPETGWARYTFESVLIVKP